jgi:predicted nucleic acid-binding protein
LTVFIDTSAFLVLLDAGDNDRRRVASTFRSLPDSGDQLLTHTYAVVETPAVAQRRLPTTAQRAFLEELLAVIDVAPVDASLHAVGVAALLASPKSPSLVDQVSFALMRERGIGTAFALDADFAKAGFAVLP